MPEVVQPVPRAQADQRDRAARALFAATELVHKNSIDREVGRSVPRRAFAPIGRDITTRFDAQVKALCDDAEPPAIVDCQPARPGEGVRQARRRELSRELRDAWDVNMRAERVPWGPENTYLLRSAGPDKQFNTADDLERISRRSGKREDVRRFRGDVKCMAEP